MRRFFYAIAQLLGGAFVIFLFTFVWILFDGLTDLGDEADVALASGDSESPSSASEPALDLAIQLYNEGEFRYIIVSGSSDAGVDDGTAAMTQYLESHKIPSTAIIEAHWGKDPQSPDQDMANILKSHHFKSVLVITDYYRVTRIKLMLGHEGIEDVWKAHVGTLRKADAVKIGREVIALYEYIGKAYLLPAVEKIKKEAWIGADKAKAGAEKAKEKVDKSLDSLPK
jgi:hypothetical protein